jgi:hypothetical protein
LRTALSSGKLDEYGQPRGVDERIHLKVLVAKKQLFAVKFRRCARGVHAAIRAGHAGAEDPLCLVIPVTHASLCLLQPLALQCTQIRHQVVLAAVHVHEGQHIHLEVKLLPSSEEAAECDEVHPHRVDGGVVAVVLVLLGRGYTVPLDHMRLARAIKTLINSSERKHGPEKRIDDDVLFVLLSCLRLRVSAHQARVV